METILNLLFHLWEKRGLDGNTFFRMDYLKSASSIPTKFQLRSLIIAATYQDGGFGIITGWQGLVLLIANVSSKQYFHIPEFYKVIQSHFYVSKSPKVQSKLFPKTVRWFSYENLKNLKLCFLGNQNNG